MPGVIEFREQDPLELLSLYSSSNDTITISRLLRKGEGRPYWENWSQKIAGGKWDHPKAFITEEEARLAGNFAILGILSHEIAHAICSEHWLNIHGDPYEELLADEYAVRMMKVWAHYKPFARLLESYRKNVTGGLRSAVPQNERIDLPPAVGTLSELREYLAEFKFQSRPSPAGYISLQLDRQRFLLGEKNLNSLSDFLAREMARRSPRHWTNDSITLDTVKPIEVPEWILANANPCAPSRFWQITDATRRSALRLPAA